MSIIEKGIDKGNNPEQNIKVTDGKRVMGFLDGSYWIVGAGDCRGCLMDEMRDQLPVYMRPIFEDRDLVVTQDAEFPIPGFYVVSPKQHLGSIADFSVGLSQKIGLVTHFVRKGMREELGIGVAEIFHEERLQNSHYHHWILPFWLSDLVNSGFSPTIFKSKVPGYGDYAPNIVGYLRSFAFGEEGQRILEFNDKMRNYLSTVHIGDLVCRIDKHFS